MSGSTYSHISLRWCCFVCCSEILKHEDLDGRIDTACLGSLLQQDELNQLEDQYLVHKQVFFYIPPGRWIHINKVLRFQRNIYKKYPFSSQNISGQTQDVAERRS